MKEIRLICRCAHWEDKRGRHRFLKSHTKFHLKTRINFFIYCEAPERLRSLCLGRYWKLSRTQSWATCSSWLCPSTGRCIRWSLEVTIPWLLKNYDDKWDFCFSVFCTSTSSLSFGGDKGLREKTERNFKANLRFGWSTFTSKQILSSEVGLKYPFFKVQFVLLAQLSMPLSPATLLLNMFCHGEVCEAQACLPAFDNLQPAIFLNELEGVAFVLKTLCCSPQR